MTDSPLMTLGLLGLGSGIAVLQLRAYCNHKDRMLKRLHPVEHDAKFIQAARYRDGLFTNRSEALVHRAKLERCLHDAVRRNDMEEATRLISLGVDVEGVGISYAPDESASPDQLPQNMIECYKVVTEKVIREGQESGR